jgi:hypothetical protein
MSKGSPHPDGLFMERRAIWLCAAVGGTIGSFVPALWGGSDLSMTSILFGLIGGVAGVVVGARVAGG